MEMVSLIILILSNQGYWFGGEPGTVTVRRVAKSPLPESVLIWNLKFGEVSLAGSRIAIRANGEPGKITLTPPEVRVRTTMQLTYVLARQTDGAVLAKGRETIHVFPRDPLHGLGQRLTGRELTLLDKSGNLSTFSKKLGVKYQCVSRLSQLQFSRTDVLLVGPDELDAAALPQTYLVDQAEKGARILILSQAKPTSLLGYRLAGRSLPAKLEWRQQHPLLNHLQLSDLQSLLPQSPTGLPAIQLPADEPALEIAYWPRETPGKKPAPIDALLVTKTLGQGRVVLCQIPIGDWSSDPRAQIFLANVLDYLTTRPEATVRPSQRSPLPQKERMHPTPIHFPSGDNP